MAARNWKVVAVWVIIGYAVLHFLFISSMSGSKAKRSDSRRAQDGGVGAGKVRRVNKFLKASNDPVIQELMNLNEKYGDRPDDEGNVPLVYSESFHGKVGILPNGEQAWKPEPMPPPSYNETVDEKKEHHKGHAFNWWRSNHTPLDREVKDVRSEACKQMRYPPVDELPKATIVIVFYNEPLSTLLRTFHSLLNRTPPTLLVEILAVDDGSSAEHLKERLDDYVKLLPKVRLIRMPERQGLMVARSTGAREAKGEVLVFLDCHIEPNRGWLEPLLARIYEDKTHVVTPIIDTLDADSFAYKAGGIDMLAFNWGLGHKHEGVAHRKREKLKPMKSPIMAGGLFAIDSDLFWRLGGYDPELRFWGAEEVEISLKIWMCGNTLECLPCSRVAHVYRSDKFWKGAAWSMPFGVLARNRMRVAEVWLDEFKNISKSVIGKLPAGMDIGKNLDKQHQLRKDLKCKSFKWYLNNIYPELFIPNDPNFVVFGGSIRSLASNHCFDTLGNNKLPAAQGKELGLYPCHYQGGTQEFALAKYDDLRVAALDFDGCVDRGSAAQRLIIWPCHLDGGNQGWKYNNRTLTLTNLDGRSCATAVHHDNLVQLETHDCIKPVPKNQQWHFVSSV